MDVLEEELPSSRIIGDPHGSLIDLPLTQVLDGTLLTVAAWYDNEQFATQLARAAHTLAWGAWRARGVLRQPAPGGRCW